MTTSAPIPTHTHTININGAEYHYVEAGSGAGKPLLLLHGFTGCAENWASVMPTLATNRRVIAIDLPGHGQTRTPAALQHFTMPHVAQDLTTFITEIFGTPAHVLGYSMGGRLALYLAAAHPDCVHTLVLESASPGLATKAERAARMASDEALADRIERDGIAKFVDAWERLPLFNSQKQLPHSVQSALRELRLRNNAHGLASSLRGMGTGAQPSLWDQLSTLACPSLLIVGAHDTKFVHINQLMAQAMPQAKLAVVAQAGHTTHLEQHATFTALVCQHLSHQ